MTAKEKKLQTLWGPPRSTPAGVLLRLLLASHLGRKLCSLSFDTKVPSLDDLSLIFVSSIASSFNDLLVDWSVLTVSGVPFGITIERFSSFFVNCVAAARAPAMAALRLDDFSMSDALDLGNCTEIDPGFRENGSSGFGSGNFTGSGPSTETRPLTAASYIYNR